MDDTQHSEATGTERLALALLTVTATVNQIMGRTEEFEARGLAAEPETVMDQTEELVGKSLAQVAEHCEDEELDYILWFLDGVLMGLAEAAGTLHLFRDPRD